MAASPEWRAPPVDFLALLGEAERNRLLEGARRVMIPAGQVADYRRNPLGADIVETGVMRVFQVSGDGRQATIGYAYSGEYLGALPVIQPLPGVLMQPLVDTHVLRLTAQAAAGLMEGGRGFDRAVAVYASTILARVVRVVTVRTLGSVMQRVAFDLLERAASDQLRSGNLVFNVTHEDIADAIGSVREVVTRAVTDLRKTGMVSTYHGRIRIEDAERLTHVVQGLVV